MTTINEIRQSFAHELGEVNNHISKSLTTSNALLNGIIENYLATKGKQIRPLLVMMAAKLFGSSINQASISAAAAIEMLHNASLIHDDVVDQTMTRRSRPTINAVWDNHMAVLVGDFFISTALATALETSNASIISIMAQLGRELSLGEVDQIDKARVHALSESAYMSIIESKTASLFEACVKLGALSVDAPADETSRLTEFTRLLGLCFQIRDDIFDYYEDTNIGKPTGNDLREGKVTLPLLYVLNNHDIPNREAMRSLAAKDTLSDDEINTLVMFARDNGGIDYAYRRMKEMRDQAVEILYTLPQSDTREAFRVLIDYVITRVI
jgi:octaprenyl-diphosphate synthase